MYYVKPAKGFITSLFSNSRKNPVLGVIRPHQGIDISSDPDNIIIASADGVVRVADNAERTGFGKYVVITHPNGQETVYAHLSAITVKVGQRVKQSQKIGMKGTSGNSSGIHLHFEVCKTRFTNDFSNKLDPLLLFIDPVTKEIQEMLNKLGHNLVADGIYGDATISAITKYQKDNRLVADGVAGRTTYAHMKDAVSKIVTVSSSPLKDIVANTSTQKGEVKMLVTNSAVLRKAYQDYLKEAIKDNIIQQSWLNDFNAGTLTIADAFLLDKIIEQRRAK